MSEVDSACNELGVSNAGAFSRLQHRLLENGGGAGGGPVGRGAVVFRPGLPSSGIFVATGTEVRTALAAGVVTVFVDDNNAPASAEVGAPWDFGNIAQLYAWENKQVNPTLIVPDGAQLRNLRGVNDTVIECRCTSLASLDFDDYTLGPSLLALYFGILFTSAAASISPIIVPDGDAASLVLDAGANIFSSGAEVFDLSATGTLVITCSNSLGGIGNTPIANDTVQGGAGSSLTIQFDASFPAVYPTFVNLVSAPVFQRGAVARSILPDSGNTLGRPTSTALVGQMYFDTQLAAGAGKPIWFNGTIWVLSDGTPA